MVEADALKPLYLREAVNRSADATAPRELQMVIITSKFCNLRCRYCYEFPDLGNRQAISPEQLQHMYRSINDHYSQLDRPTAIEFVWFGGEPLLLGPQFYWRTFDEQTRIFDAPKVTVTNVVQTNLTALKEPLIKLLSEGFDGVGVSIDLFSGLRVNTKGIDLQPTVLKNMDRLRQAGVPYGCITVLSRRNIASLRKIFHFFSEASISARIVPVYRGADDTQNDIDSLSEEETLQALIDLFEMWIETSAPIIIEPLYSLSLGLIRALNGNNRSRYDKREWESLYVVNTDGNLYSYSDQFDVSLSHGNLFNESMHAMVNGAGHQRAILAAERRIAATCTECRHYGRSCSGYPVAEESPGRRDSKPHGEGAACTRERGILDYIERRLPELGVVDHTGCLDPKSKYFHHFDPTLRIRM